MSGALAHGELAGAVALLVGAALALLAVGRAAARRRRARLLGTAAPRGPRRADLCLAAALAAAALALLGPRAGERTLRVPASGVDVVILTDVSLSMLARDVPPSRLERARALAADVLARLGPGDRAALAAFAGEGVLLTPLTPDHGALAELAPALDPSLLSEQGSRLEAGVRAALSAYRPDSPRPRVLLVLSDGEDPEDGAPPRSALAAAGVRVVAVAFGGASGAAVPYGGVPLRDDRGEAIATRAEPARLGALAEPTDGTLFEGDRFGAVDPDRVAAAVRRDAARAQEGFVERRVPRSAAPALAALAFALALAAAWPARRAPHEAVAFVPAGAPPGRAGAARAEAHRGAAPARPRARAAAVAALAALGLGAGPPAPGAPGAAPGAAPGTAETPEARALEALRDALRARAAERAGDPSPSRPVPGPVPDAAPEDVRAALAEAEDAVRAEPENPAALVRLGLARARAGLAEEAERAFFAAAVRAGEPAPAALAWYDLGVAALERGDLERARDAFFDALALAPRDDEARFNLEWTLRALAAREASRRADPTQASPRREGGERADERSEGEGGEERRPAPPKPGEEGDPAARQPRVAPGSARGTPVQLDPEAAAQWLAAVPDDPAQALRALAPAKRRGAAARTRAPRW